MGALCPTSLGVVQAGDIEEALAAASAIGDDRLQMQAQGYVTPDTFTHGTSEQRVRWFKRGFETGDLSRGDTFSASACSDGRTHTAMTMSVRPSMRAGSQIRSESSSITPGGSWVGSSTKATWRST